ncbi:MAG: response regulator [Anaerolineae bacterium]|nr:response regulator [Anaerolineae bacterium]
MLSSDPTQYPVVLYVEDDALSREIMEFYLENAMGFSRNEQIHVFENSQDFVPRLNNLPAKPDIVLLDIHMQPINGFEVLSQLRSQPGFEHTPVVALTASVMNEEIAMLRNAGFNGCIAKPINQATFADNLQKVLEGETIWQI